MKGKSILAVLTLIMLLMPSCAEKEDVIFNGKDLANWNFVIDNDSVPAEDVYSVDNGVIRIKGEPLGYMYSEKKYRNYTLELEYRWAEEESNSGIFIFIEEPLSPFPKGIECQLAAGNAGDLVLLAGANLEEYVLPEGVTERPQFPIVNKQQPSNEKPAGEWNKIKITANEGIIEVYVNDILQNRATNQVKEGHIGLQSEGKEIHFRNITVK